MSTLPGNFPATPHVVFDRRAVSVQVLHAELELFRMDSLSVQSDTEDCPVSLKP